MKRLKKLILILITLTVNSAYSAPLNDFTFKSPAFNGNGYGTYVLTIQNEEYTRAQAIQQALLAAQQQAKTDAANTPLNQFLVNLESRIYAQISQNLATAMFGSGSSTQGTMNFQGNTISYVNQGSNIQLTVTDNLGNQTVINVPIGQFNITGQP